MSNYPDDIRQYDNDPRSPFYDDKGKGDFIDQKVYEYMEDISQLAKLDMETIYDIVINEWNNDQKEAGLIKKLAEYFNDLAEKQAEHELDYDL